MRARIVAGANYGDEGKGTVTAFYTKNAEGRVVNVLTNGGSQRGHSILTDNGSMTFQHFGAGTYYGADNYYSRYFILNPMQFSMEYDRLLVKPKRIYRHYACRWTTPYDSMANLIEERQRNRHASCCMGIWNTVRRYRDTNLTMPFDKFVSIGRYMMQYFLETIKDWYERSIDIPDDFADIWNSAYIKDNFIDDCLRMDLLTISVSSSDQIEKDEQTEFIFENGQGLLLSDTGRNTFDTTPSRTGIEYALNILKEDFGYINDITAHYVTRPYLTRHGDGFIEGETEICNLSSFVEEDRTNHYNEFQGDFRYGKLDIQKLQERILKDAKETKVILEVTHCDEMDRIDEFSKLFANINTYDNPLV